MAIKIYKSNQQDCLVVEFSGDIASHSFSRFLRHYHPHHASNRYHRHLWDFTQVKKAKFNALDIQKLAYRECVRKSPPHIRVALVTESGLTFGLARVFLGWANDTRYQVFKDRTAAEGWLAL